MLCETSFDSMQHGPMTRDSAFTLFWWHCEGRDMVDFKLLRPADFEMPFAYCREEMVYVRHLYALICACAAGALHPIERASSLH